jgi:hypothetical protein
VSGASWQGRTAAALAIGAGGEGLCVLLAKYVAGGFVLLTLVVAVAVGWYFGPIAGTIGIGLPPLGLAFVDDASRTLGEQITAALAVVLLLAGSAWITARVRERYGEPPWPHPPGPSE